MILWKALEMSYTKIINPLEDAIEMVMKGQRIPATGAYETVNSTPSSVDEKSAHVRYIDHTYCQCQLFLT